MTYTRDQVRDITHTPMIVFRLILRRLHHHYGSIKWKGVGERPVRTISYLPKQLFIRNNALCESLPKVALDISILDIFMTTLIIRDNFKTIARFRSTTQIYGPHTVETVGLLTEDPPLWMRVGSTATVDGS